MGRKARNERTEEDRKITELGVDLREERGRETLEMRQKSERREIWDRRKRGSGQDKLTKYLIREESGKETRITWKDGKFRGTSEDQRTGGPQDQMAGKR